MVEMLEIWEFLHYMICTLVRVLTKSKLQLLESVSLVSKTSGSQ